MLRVALLTSTLLALVDARIYERCELARDLTSLGIKREHIATWVCIAFHESRFDTAARNPHSGDHGLLQISELYWCGAGKACGLPCSALRDNDISDDVACALRVHEEHTRLQGDGFLAWVVYPHHCKHNAKKYLADCDSSVKTPYVRTDGRARVLKSEDFNFTTTSFPHNPKIDELLPPYLTVNNFLRGTYEKEFEKNYNKNARVNWLTYKIDNIDDLKLPVFNRKLNERYTTSTVTTSTTTTQSPLPKIKPPSPRKIESNSFRGREMRPILEADKFSESTDHPISYTRTLPTKMVGSDVFTEKYITHKDLIPITATTALAAANPAATTTTITKVTTPLTTTISTSIPSTIIYRTTSTAKPSTKSVHFSFPVTYEHNQTTKVPIFHGSFPSKTTSIPEVPTKNTNERSASATEKSSQNVSLTAYSKNLKNTTTFGKISDSIDDSKKNNSANKTPREIWNVVTTKLDTLNTVGVNKYYSFDNPKSQVSSTTTIRPTYWSAWRTPTTTTSTTSRPVTVSQTTSKTQWTTLSDKLNEKLSTSKGNDHTTTTKPQTKSFWSDSKLFTSQLPGFKEITSSTTVPSTQTTTSKNWTTWPGINTRWTWTSSTFPSSRNTERSTIPNTNSGKTASLFGGVTERSTSSNIKPMEKTTLSPTTARTTQSIFDLYLKPTTRPKLPAYRFPFINNNAFSLRIFSGGTTTHSPSFSTHERSKTS